MAEGPDGQFYLFSNDPLPPNQNFNIQTNDIVVCFLPGTRIRTSTGDVEVERLAIGDSLLTPDGRAVPVKWIGRQSLSTVFGLPDSCLPIRISAGALGQNLPVRELRLTPSHAVLLDDVLVHAAALLNGTTITRMSRSDLGDRLVVYHVETEGHEIILAEGAASETFVDNVARRHFDNYPEFEQLYGTAPEAMTELAAPRAMSPRQVPASIRSRISAVADALSSGRRQAA